MDRVIIFHAAQKKIQANINSTTTIDYLNSTTSSITLNY